MKAFEIKRVQLKQHCYQEEALFSNQKLLLLDFKTQISKLFWKIVITKKKSTLPGDECYYVGCLFATQNLIVRFDIFHVIRTQNFDIQALFLLFTVA